MATRKKTKTAAEPAAALTDLLGSASDNTLALNPLLGIRADDLAQAAKTFWQIAAASPQRAVGSYAQYLQECGRILRGTSELAPEPKDRRFADAAWKSNRLYKSLMQGHLAAVRHLADFIDGAETGSREKGQAHFITSLVTDALAPSNWLLGNPVAVRKLVETGGAHLVDGAKNLLHDLQHNHGLPSQVDATPFKVGGNMATTPGQVVLRHAMFELIQYTPSTPQVHARPLVISPPQVNKFYAMDLGPGKSLVQWAVDSGVQVFMISWRNPTAEQRDWGLEQYVMAIDTAVNTACEITGSPDASLFGSCSGGMSAAAYLGWSAGKGRQKVVNTTWSVCILDCEAALEDSTLGLFTSPTVIDKAKAHSHKKGVIEGSEMASMFAWLRPNDLIWNYWVNNYLLGNKPPAYDVLAWNADTTRLTARYHSDLLDMFAKNPYVNPGTLVIDGVPIDIGQVKVDAFVTAGITDHITPWKGCYGTARLFGADATFVLANAGHLQSLINPPGSAKSFYFTGPASEEDPLAWAKKMEGERREGSWWPLWRQWLQARSGELVPAPQKPGSRKYKPLCAAPGEYVLEK
ncbi:MAG: alpha/beta fold hydrolase [Acidovorax sp.]